MKRITININKKNNNNFSFRNFNNPSKDLDDLILSNLIKMNPYLKKDDDATLDAMLAEAGMTDDRIIIPNRDRGFLMEGNFDTEFAKAAKFLSSYTPKKKIYTASGDDIYFFEDEIQIGTTLIPLYKLSSPIYYKNFTPEMKKTIINIFININR